MNTGRALRMVGGRVEARSSCQQQECAAGGCGKGGGVGKRKGGADEGSMAEGVRVWGGLQSPVAQA